MKPIIVSPLHDPTGILFPHIQSIEAQLQELFDRVYISISPPTQNRQPEFVQWFQNNPFFEVLFNHPNSLPGDHYLTGYKFAVKQNPSDQVFHLCDLDRVAYVLNTNHQHAYIQDLERANQTALTHPVLFQRSEQAWNTYPENYREIELILNKSRLIVL